MAFAAISYKVQPGHEDEIAEIFSAENFRRADSPVLRDDDGAEVGRLQATALFIQDDLMVRVIQYQGDMAAIGRHMAGQRGVHEAERKLAPFLAASRDTDTAEGFKQHFRNSLMAKVDERVIEDRPANLAVLRYRVKPGYAKEIGEAFRNIVRDARPQVAGPDGKPALRVLGIGLFVKDDAMIRVVQYEGEFEDVANYMANRPMRTDIEEKLAPYMADDHRPPRNPEEFLDRFHKATMRRISQLTVDTLPAG
nr:monooxygenase [uncultured bacterium]